MSQASTDLSFFQGERVCTIIQSATNVSLVRAFIGIITIMYLDIPSLEAIVHEDLSDLCPSPSPVTRLSTPIVSSLSWTILV